MSLKKGSKVEVLIKKKVPHGMWRAAEIVSCDGDEYTVSYECYPGISRKGGLERIKRESVRPSPPVKVVANLAVGDGVEVFDNGFWKVAFIREAMEGDCYFIKLIGSIDEFKVHKSKVRVRQTWRDNNWVITGKDSVICEDLMYKMLARTSMHTGGDCTGVQSGIAVPGSGSYSLSKKRAVPNDFNNFEACDENPHKKRAIDKADSFYLAASGYLSSFTRKVDFAAYAPENQSRNNSLAFSNESTTVKCKVTKRNSSDIGVRISELDDADSIASSVGSCRVISDSFNRSCSHSFAGCTGDNDDLSSDAESYDHSKEEELGNILPPGVIGATGIHSLELQAYRCTLESLYASGPLSWELETCLSNLRSSLHISNDEHLSELRSLRPSSRVLYAS